MSKVNNQLSAAAIEKPLKKINELIHNGSNKKAVQEVDRLPKDIKSQNVFKTLKALALIHMCKRKQAFDILGEIDLEDDLDGATLETMTLCYKQSVDVERIVELFEAASQRKPSDERIMEELFMSHVRAFNFRRQKEIALQMYKAFSTQKRLHSFWAVMSLVMQSQACQGDAPDKRVCLSLAEKMCERMMDDERNIEEIELYLTILRKQNKYEEEYKFLTGPVCLRIQDPLSWFTRRRAYLCLDLKMYSRAFKHYFPTLIQDYPDQIEYYQGLFRSAFLLDTEAPSQQQPVVIADQQSSNAAQTNAGTPVKSTSALAECFDIVEKQFALTIEGLDQAKDQSRAKSQLSKNLSRTSSLNPNTRRHLLRGPFMARIELYHTISSNESVLPKSVFNFCRSQFEFKFPNLNSLLLDYFQSFSRKIICFHDLDHMIKTYQLSRKDQDHLLDIIDTWVEGLEQHQPDISAYDMFHIRLNRDMLIHLLHEYKTSDTRDSRLKLARKFIDSYDENRHLGNDSNKTEFLPVDHYCLLVVNSIMTNSVDRESMTAQKILSDSILITLIVLLESAVANSPNNHQLKLTLLKLYSFVGASKQCSKVLLTLDIKHFQIDTLGHLLNPVLYNTGNLSLSNQSLETCLDSHIHSYRECFECLTNSYCHGRFSRIGEISGVFERLRDSLNASQCVLLKGIVSHLNASNLDELMAASHSFDAYKSLHRIFRCSNGTDIIKDNRDFKVLRSLHADTTELIQKRQQESLEDEKMWLKLRYYIIRSVYIQLEYFGKLNAETPQVKELLDVEELLHGKRELSEILPKLDVAINSAATGNNLSDKRYSYFEPESSPFRWSHIRFQSLISLVNPLVFLWDISAVDSKLQESYNSHLESLINDLATQLASVSSLVEMKQALLSLTITVEFISLVVTSLVSMTHAGFASGSSSGGNQMSNSTNQSKPIPSKNKSIPHQMLSKTESQLLKLSNSIKNFDPKILLADEASKLEGSLLSGQSHVSLKTKSGVSVVPLLGTEANKTHEFVKENLLDSYTESLKEIETVCRNKIKLIR